MVTNVSDVLSAYKNVGGIIDDNSAASSASPTGMGSFASTLKGVMGDTIKSLHEGESAAVASANGTGNMASVVTAIDNAELLLTQITAIRDKAITAYQSITSSAI